ncbi:25971_t:CDS:2, partial [Dentiscutata erythropus]
KLNQRKHGRGSLTKKKDHPERLLTLSTTVTDSTGEGFTETLDKHINKQWKQPLANIKLLNNVEVEKPPDLSNKTMMATEIVIDKQPENFSQADTSKQIINAKKENKDINSNVD